MKKYLKIFVIYFPVILVSCQVLLNGLSFFFPKFYADTGFYLNLLFGTNAMYAVMLLAMTYLFKYCEVSRWCAWAEVLYAIMYGVIQKDNEYNIWFQIITGTIALLVTFRKYISKYPTCKLSLMSIYFFGTITHGGNCHKGYEKMERVLNKKNATD